MNKPSWLNLWTYLSIASIPIAAFFVLFTEVRNWVILVIHVSGLISILIGQKLWYRFQFEICGRCFIQREFHNKRKYNKIKYPQLEGVVCEKFQKGKYA